MFKLQYLDWDNEKEAYISRLAEAFDNYMDAFEILEGPEALNRIRNAILAEKDRLAQDVQLITEV